MRERLIHLWRDWHGVILFLGLMFVFRSAVADWNQVPSGSMKPGILAGDRIVVDKLAWELRVPFTNTRITRWAEPARGDVVTFENPVDGRLFVKRVVAVPGDQVEWRRKQLIINGEPATYTPLREHEARALQVDIGPRQRLYREELLGSRRVVMLHSEPGRYDPRRNPLAGVTRVTRCDNRDIVTAGASPPLADAICRCGALSGSACATFPPFHRAAGQVLDDGRLPRQLQRLARHRPRRQAAHLRARPRHRVLGGQRPVLHAAAEPVLHVTGVAHAVGAY